MPQPGNGDAGWFIDGYYQSMGPGDLQVVNPSLDIPSNIADAAPPDTGAVIFAPTHKPYLSCIEASEIYVRHPGDATTTREMGWYDFCGSPHWVTMEDVNDQAWQNTYLYTYTNFAPAAGETEYVIWIGIKNVAGTDCWQGVIFNLIGSHYDQKAYDCGTPSVQDGWSMWESYYIMTNLTDPSFCPVLSRTYANVLLFTDTVNYEWHPLNNAATTEFTYGQPCWTSGFYAKDFWVDTPSDSAFTEWRGLTP